MIAGAAYVVVTEFSVEDIEISGNYTYTNSEIIGAIKKEYYVPNVFCMIVENKVFHANYLPFIEEVTMSVSKDARHTLKVRVKEKMRAGVFEDVDFGKHIYFNDEGIAVESRIKLFDGVPIIKGVPFDKIVLGERIPAEEEYFKTIVAITKKITTYSLGVSEIKFDAVNEITLILGDYEIYLGNSNYLENKMSRITPIVESLEKKKKVGRIDMSLLTDENDIITFKKR